MLLVVESIAMRALTVAPAEPSVAPTPPAFAAIERGPAYDLVYLVELYPYQPPGDS